MKDYSEVDIKIEFDKLPEIIEYIKRLKKERDYYKKIVQQRCKLFILNEQ
jgi:hypothetical protein